MILAMAAKEGCGRRQHKKYHFRIAEIQGGIHKQGSELIEEDAANGSKTGTNAAAP